MGSDVENNCFDEDAFREWYSINLVRSRFLSSIKSIDIYDFLREAFFEGYKEGWNAGQSYISEDEE